MNILVVGGSYFFGRWFVQLAHMNHKVTVLNRGNIKVNLPGVDELVADRRDENRLKELERHSFDCIVDFCGYEEDDIALIQKYFGKENAKYIFISTVDVYKKGTGKLLDEEAELEDRELPGEVGAYITGKVKLERELKKVSLDNKMVPVSVRPSILYGPANYAPRDKYFYDCIMTQGKVLAPSDSDGFFQFIFVKDAVRGLMAICEADNSSIEPSYNFTNGEKETYDSFLNILEEIVDKSFEKIPVGVKEVSNLYESFPFPLVKEESEKYSSMRFDGLNTKKTSLKEGLKSTFESY